MENASKALLLAASIILGVLLFSTFLYMESEIGIFQSSKMSQQLIAQNSAFNNKFEAYNKTFMYGTDVISVVSMAYNSNLKYYNQYSDSEKENAQMYYINIKINIKDNLSFSCKGYDIVSKDFKENSDVNTDRILNRIDRTNIINNLDDDVYELKLFSEDDSNKWMYSNMIKDSTSSDNHDNQILSLINTTVGPTKIKLSSTEYALVYDWKTDFKRSAFFCESVEYSPETGRIRQMTFVQQKLEEE